VGEREKTLVILTLGLDDRQVTQWYRLRPSPDVARTDLLTLMRQKIAEVNGPEWDDAVVIFFFAERDSLD
jgi:hypothetical protein